MDSGSIATLYRPLTCFFALLHVVPTDLQSPHRGYCEKEIVCCGTERDETTPALKFANSARLSAMSEPEASKRGAREADSVAVGTTAGSNALIVSPHSETSVGYRSLSGQLRRWDIFESWHWEG
jgi:hypothetical protein